MGRPVNVAFALIAVVAGVLLLLWIAQRRLIYFPTQSLMSARDAGLPDAESITFSTPDGLTLGGWFVGSTGPAPRVTVLVLNGNAGNRAYRAPLAAALREAGLQVLLIDYRGYGGNPGTPTEEGLHSDAAAALTYLKSRADVDSARLVYFGESLGAAVALRLAVEHPPAALILRSPFASLADVGRHHYPVLPVGLLLRDRFASIDIAGRIRSPVLMIAGDRDAVVPIGHSQRLYDAIEAPKSFVTIAGADHNDLELLAGDEMIQAVLRFITRVA
jgi:uncharacterized protein